MKVFEYSNWRYDIGRHNDIMECVTCGEEISIGYVMALSADKVDDQINTDQGQRCGNCIAMFLSTTNYDIAPPTILKESI